MEFKHFIGIDVSKATLDMTVVVAGKPRLHQQISNTTKDIKAAVPKLLKTVSATLEDTLFCMEYTGIYNVPLLNWLQSQCARVWLESGVQIAKSTGVTRGKNDKVDSYRIAMYAFTNRHQARLWKAPKPVLGKLSALLSQRSRLIKAKRQLTTALKEQSLFLDKSIVRILKGNTDKVVTVLKQQIKAIEKEIHLTVNQDENLQRLNKIITSIDGVGFVTSAYVIITTGEFTTITDAKKYACYAGVVPFEQSSGTSYKTKARVSHKANKTVKKLLHLSAMAAIKMKGDLYDYYQRKVAEGKNKMSVVNAIRNKLVLRIFACVKQNRLFEKKYAYSLV